MNQHEARKRLVGISMKSYEVDHIRLIESHFFNNPEPVPTKKKNDDVVRDASMDKDYRESTIDYCIKNNIPFCSSCNTATNIIERLVVMRCPKCGNPMEGTGSGECGSSYGMDYRCSCGMMLTLRFNPNDVIRFHEHKMR